MSEVVYCIVYILSTLQVLCFASFERFCRIALINGTPKRLNQLEGDSSGKNKQTNYVDYVYHVIYIKIKNIYNMIVAKYPVACIRPLSLPIH